MFVSKNMERLADIRSLASIPSESQVSVYCRMCTCSVSVMFIHSS